MYTQLWTAALICKSKTIFYLLLDRQTHNHGLVMPRWSTSGELQLRYSIHTTSIQCLVVLAIMLLGTYPATHETPERLQHRPRVRSSCLWHWEEVSLAPDYTLPSTFPCHLRRWRSVGLLCSTYALAKKRGNLGSNKFSITWGKYFYVTMQVTPLSLNLTLDSFTS